MSFTSGAERHVFQPVWRICFWSEKHVPPLFISCRTAVVEILPGHLEPVCIYVLCLFPRDYVKQIQDLQIFRGSYCNSVC